MRKLLLVASLLFASAMPSLAQADDPAVKLSPVNCDALNQGTFICVSNATPRPITKITCSGFWGTSDLSISHGLIPAGGTTIVNFDAGKCAKHIVVFTRDGHQYPFDGFDTKNNTTLLVNND